MAPVPGLTGRDDLLLEEIRRRYHDLPKFTGGRCKESAAYQAGLVAIRALVDQWTQIRGDEMIVALEKAPGFGTE